MLIQRYLILILFTGSYAHAEFLNEFSYQFNDAGNQLLLKDASVETGWRYPERISPVGKNWQQYLINVSSADNATQAFCDYRIRQAYVEGQVASTHYRLHDSGCHTSMPYGCVIACAPVETTVQGTSSLFHDINMIIDGND